MSRLGIPGLTAAVVLARAGALGGGVRPGRPRERRARVRTTTSYRLASVSKPITAVAVLQLAEPGKLDLDAPVQRYVPVFPEKPWPVTTRQLLGHLGGVRHYEDGRVREHAALRERWPTRSPSSRTTRSPTSRARSSCTRATATTCWAPRWRAPRARATSTTCARNVFEPAGMFGRARRRRARDHPPPRAGVPEDAVGRPAELRRWPTRATRSRAAGLAATRRGRGPLRHGAARRRPAATARAWPGC